MSGGPPMDRRRMLRLTALFGVSAVSGGSLVAGLIREARMRQVRITRPHLGTIVTVTLVHPEGEAARALAERTFGEIERLESILSRHRRDSVLGRLNRSGTVDCAPDELGVVLRHALDLARETEGAFDPTVAPLLALYGAAAANGALPSGSALEERLRLVGHQRVRIEGQRVHMEPGTALTLDGVAKGFVVDRAVDLLVRGGAERVILDAGGDMASGGSGPEPWNVELQHPRSPGERLGSVLLAGNAVATSGDYVQTFTPDLRHHHILDPRTGRSPDQTSSVSVVAPSAMEADALSTAAFVLGPERGRALLESRSAVSGLIVDRQGRRFATEGFSRA